LPRADLEVTEPLGLSHEEAALASHALRFYMNAKGYEVSRNTQELEAKLQSYIEHRLGPRKMTIELDES
jgi:hypothetical protein